MSKPGLEINLDVYPDEAALLAALRRGEGYACTCMVKRFATPLYRAVLRILNDPDEVEAIVQASFIKACGKFDTFEERSQLGTWLQRVAINEALMRRRQRATAQGTLTEAGDVDLHTLPQQRPDDDPAAAVLGQELRAQLEQAIAQLPEHYRMVFVLRDLSDLSVKETAETLNISESTVKVRLHRARQQLRDLLKGYLAA
jgi:RNA polymerase sigma-70 factor (ECF subfamily)